MYAPIGVPSPYTEGKPYLVETTDDRTAVAALDLAQWNLWSVIGEHLVSGGSKRIITDASAFAYAVSVFELNDLQSNDWLAVGAGAANAYTWFNVDVNNFNLVDKTGGLVTHGVTGPNRTLTFSGDVRFVHTTAGNQENVVVYPLASSPTPSRSFAGHFTFNGTTQYFIPSVSGTYDVYEEIVTYTNWELITTIRQLFATSKVTRWTNNSNRLKSVAPNINTSNTGTVDLIAGEVYEIDPSAGGGTNQGSHLVTLTLRS